MNKYTIKTKKTKSDGFGNLECQIFKNDEYIGSYNRNYHNFCNTFFPFELNGKELALYSPSYTVTRILSLPDCTDIGGEESNSCGFCPVDFYIPSYIKYKYGDSEFVHTDYDVKETELSEKSILIQPLTYVNFGFVAGCHWGDDSSWKIQYLDLSEADKGVLKRDDRFGYIELTDKLNLKESIKMHDNGYVNISIQNTYRLEIGESQ